LRNRVLGGVRSSEVRRRVRRVVAMEE